jgi:hypothetical protein
MVRVALRAGATPIVMVLFLGLAGLSGCQPQEHAVTATPSRTLTEVLAAHTPELMQTPGVVGTAESRLDDGRPCILVMVVRLTAELRARLPHQLEGWPVRIEETGEIHALPDTAR